jgi:hypothetical protein
VIEVTQTETARAPASQGANKRAAFRIDLACAALLVAEPRERGTDDWVSDRAGKRTLHTVTEDVSTGGVRLRLPAPLRDRARVALRLDIPGIETDLLAEVMHSRADQFGVAAGLRFVIIDPRTRAELTRFIAAEERRRLPNVRVMYAAECSVPGEADTVECSTVECTPGFVKVLARHAIAPATPTTLTVTVVGSDIRLEGTVVKCQRAGIRWETGVQLTRTDPIIAAAWSDMLVHLRAETR